MTSQGGQEFPWLILDSGMEANNVRRFLIVPESDTATLECSSGLHGIELLILFLITLNAYVYSPSKNILTWCIFGF